MKVIFINETDNPTHENYLVKVSLEEWRMLCNLAGRGFDREIEIEQKDLRLATEIIKNIHALKNTCDSILKKNEHTS